MATHIPEMLTEKEVARLTGFSVLTLRNQRARGAGPRYFKVGRAVRYRADDVKAWLLADPRGHGPEGQKGGAE